MFRARSHFAVVAMTAAIVAALLSPAHAGSPGDVSPDRAAPQLTIVRTTTGTVVTGATVSFTGTAPAALDGHRAALQRRVGTKGDWVKVASATISSGRMAASGVATGVGKNSWRFVLKADGTRYSSPALAHKVYGWFYLFDQEIVDSSGGFPDSWVIGGKTYGKSVGGDGNSNTDWLEYNLSYRCITLDAYIGIGDDSETGTAADFYVTLDGARENVGSQGLGPAAHLVLDTSTRLRVRLEMDPTNPDEPDGSWAFGNARILCSGKP